MTKKAYKGLFINKRNNLVTGMGKEAYLSNRTLTTIIFFDRAETTIPGARVGHNEGDWRSKCGAFELVDSGVECFSRGSKRYDFRHFAFVRP